MKYIYVPGCPYNHSFYNAIICYNALYIFSPSDLQSHLQCFLHFSIATLVTILVEEPFLVRLSAAYFDLADSEMHKITQFDGSTGSHFHIIHKFSVALLARQVHLNAPLQFFIP